ncbi:MAG: hypothetical protein SGI99_17440 [Pseudomonadota bacterium]|nr:hypothetical protein [Pseudomonadota bacterium]
MKKNALTNAVIAGIAGVAGIASVANAININPDGLGQVLLYPYYTVNAGNQTLVSVVNTTDAGKAVKVRFLEGRNSREVLDFNLYLSPFDVWTAAVFSLSDTGPNNPGNIVTLDNSCTVPRIKGNPSLPQLGNGNRYAPFLNFAYTGSNNEAGPNTLDRTREGHFEMIEMGEVTNVDFNSLAAITHGSTGVPANCLQVERAWLPFGAASAAVTYWTINQFADMDLPQGGLFGSASIIDALQGTMLAYNADAVDAFSDIIQHTDPGSQLPSLISARSTATTAVANVFSNGTVITSTYPLTPIATQQAGGGIDAVSAVFSHDALFNEFITSASVGGASEWVVTFPTKFAYVDQAITGLIADPPFTRIFPTASSATNTGIAPVDVNLTVFNREEGPNATFCSDPTDPSCVPFSPRPPEGQVETPQLLWETNVITFNQPEVLVSGSTILGSRLAANVDAQSLGVFDGWMRLGLYEAVAGGGSLINLHQSHPDTTGNVWNGLPTTGFWAASFTNGAVTPGVLANYSGLFKHKGSRSYGSATVP